MADSSCHPCSVAKGGVREDPEGGLSRGHPGSTCADTGSEGLMTDRIGVRRTLVRAGALLMFLILAGATYQGVATALERRRFPRPGSMVDVGGHQLHIYCI